MQPVPFVWDAEAGVLRPDPKYLLLCRNRMQDGRRYVMEAVEVDDVSPRERGRYHAIIRRAHDQLTPEQTARYPTVSDMRHRALINTGWYVDSYLEAANEQAAQAIGVWALKDRANDGVVVTVSGNAVRVRAPRSQKVGDPEEGHMTKEEYRRSCEDVLEYLAGVLGITRAELERG
jgi:hypothetical protein